MILITDDMGVATRHAEELAVMNGGRVVECEPTERLLTGIRMPYTRTLVDAIPRLDLPPHSRLTTIEGR